MTLPTAEPRLPDTNILVHLIRDDRLARRIEADYGFRRPSTLSIISAVVEGEIESLALQFRWGDARKQRMRDLLDGFLLVPLGYSGIVAAYARIDTHCRQIGRSMGQNDLWIAATAHATGARLITTDTDFDHLDPLFLTRDWIDPKAS
jgi:predicted nucleic acid-binding protein